MATRYTYKSLCADVAAINVKLERVGSNRYLEVGGRNGYTAIDVLSQDQHNYRKGLSNGHSGCLRMLVGGTPRECFHAVETFYYQQLLEIERGRAWVEASSVTDECFPCVYLMGKDSTKDMLGVAFPEFKWWSFHSSSGGKTVGICLTRGKE